MISASKEFKEKLKKDKDERVSALVNYADITLFDGTVLHLTYKDFRIIGGCTIEDKTMDGKFGVGFTIGKTLQIRLENNDERFSQYDFYQSVINLYVAMQLDNGSIEKIKKGVYYVTVPSTTGDIIEISAVDGMFKLDSDYSSSSTSYPATLQKIVSDVCLDCGIPIGFTQFDNMSYIVENKPEKTTYRQVLSYALQIAGYNARIDNDGYMKLVWYNTNLLSEYNNYDGGNFKTYPHDTVVDGGNFKDYSSGTVISGALFTDEMPQHIFRIKTLDVHTDDIQITGVRVVGEEDKSVLKGEEGYVIEIKDNPFAYRSESEVANYLGQRMIGITFRPYSAEVLNNPLYEPFEVIMLSDRKGNVYYSLITAITYTTGGYTQISCEAEDPARNGSRYFSEAATAVVEARRTAKKQLTTYDKAVQNMNQLAANAMGLFFETETQPNGSVISYESTKPITKDSDGICHFESGSTVYKKSDAGFLVSTDGGKSYTGGFDAQQNAVVNVLYAIGIVCDWIKGGTLTLGGMDNANGVLEIVDSSGKLIGKWDKDGINTEKGTFSGKLEAATGTFKGELKAATGTFSGELSAATGTFKGKLEAATGTFKGELQAATGTFSGELTSDNGIYFAKIAYAALQGGKSKSETTGYAAFSTRYQSTGIFGTKLAGKGIISLCTPYLGIGDWADINENAVVSIGQSGSTEIVTGIDDNGDGTITWHTKTITFEKGLMVTAL